MVQQSLPNKIQNSETTIWLKVKDFTTRTRVIWERKPRSPSWIIGPPVLLKHCRQWNRTKCIYVTSVIYASYFALGLRPLHQVDVRATENESTREHARAHTRCYVKKESIIPSFFYVHINCFTRLSFTPYVFTISIFRWTREKGSGRSRFTYQLSFQTKIADVHRYLLLVQQRYNVNCQEKKKQKNY